MGQSLLRNAGKGFDRLAAWTIFVIGATLFCGCKQQAQVARPDPDWSLRRVLAVSDQIDICRLDKGAEHPSVSLANGSNSEMFVVLKQTKSFHSSTSQARPDFVFRVPFGEGKVYYCASGPFSEPTFNYVSQSGELERGKDWCYVPDKFKRWMLKVRAGSFNPKQTRVLQQIATLPK